ncbi:hypothetical protein [Novosphingobium sp. CCH12-A3]|uniref:beta strand repeat-containing protein n=1 Tax=Novosphingobium sp. CCH12-A3 TaxID=1768752 RepID=UPI001E2B840E|nr:hypothetical protein [Novosphingobium sp. CCH12-A3]
MTLGADSLQAGTLDAGGDLTLAVNTALNLADIANAAGTMRASFGTFDFVGLNAGGSLDLAGANLAGREIVAVGDAAVALTGDYAVTAFTGYGSLHLKAQTASGAAIDVIGNFDGGVVGLASLQGYSAGGSLNLSAGELDAQAIYGDNVDLRILGVASLVTADAFADFAFTADTISASALTARGNLSLTANDTIKIQDNAAALGDMSIAATDLTAFRLTTDGGIDLQLRNSASVNFASVGGLLSISTPTLTFEAMSANDIQVDGGSLNGGGLYARNALTVVATGRAEMSAGAGRAISITAGSLVAPVVESAAGDVSLAANSSSILGDVSAFGGTIAVVAGEINVGSAKASGRVQLNAITIGGRIVEAGTSAIIDASNSILLDKVAAGEGVTLAGGDIDVNVVTAGTLVDYSGREVRIGTTDTGTAVLVSARNFSFDTLSAADSVGISTRLGIIGNTIEAGTLDAKAAGDVALGLVNAEGGVTISGANLRVSVVNGSSNVSLDASNSADSVTLNVLGKLDITAASLLLDTSTSGLDSTFTVTDTATLGTVTSSGGSVFIDPALLTFDAIGAAGGITLAGGTITGGTLDAGTSIAVTATGALTLASATSGTTMTLGADSLQAVTLDAGGDLGISTAGGVSLTDLRAGGAVSIDAAGLDAVSLTGDGNLSMTIGDRAEIGTVSVFGSFNLNAASLLLGTSRSGLESVLAISGSAQIGSISAGLADTGQNLVQVVVQALGNSYTGGQLLPIFDVVQGQTFTVSSSTNDLWSAGPLPRFSDADGLVAFRLSTAQDDSGVQPGTQIGAQFGSLTIGNFTAPFGALVGEVAGQRVLVGANGTITAPATGTLSVGYWDSNSGDNTGSISFNFGLGAGSGGPASNPASVTVTTGSNLTIGTAKATSAITLDAGGALQLDSADAGTAMSLVGNTIDAGTLTAGSDITIASTGASLIDKATAGGMFTAATGALDFNMIDAASDAQIRSLAGTQGGDLIAGANITIDDDGDVTISRATAADTVAIATGGALSYGSVDGSNVTINAASARGGAMTARTGKLRIDVVGDLTTGQLIAGGSLELTARDATLASAQSGADFSASVRSLSAPVLGASGSFTLAGSGKVEVGTATAGTALDVTSQSLTFTRMSSGGSLGVITSGNVVGGDLVATGQIRIATGTGSFTYGRIEGGGIAISGRTVSGGALWARTLDLAISVSGDASLGAIDAAGDVDVVAGNLGFSLITAGGAFRSANTAMTGTSISAGGDIDLTTQGDLAVSALSGASARISSRGIVNISGLQLTGAISVQADAVGLDSLGNLQIIRIVANDGNVVVSANGSIGGGTVAAAGDIDLLARNGSVIVSHLSAGYDFANGAGLRQLALVTPGVRGQGDIDIAASGDIVINDVADAAETLTLNAGNTIRVNGLATGAKMDLTSADLAIAASGRLGEATHTNEITLRNTGQGPLKLGDNIASAASGYAISQAEFANIRSGGDLTIRANQALLVGDLAVAAQAGTVPGQIGENGTLSLASGGLASFLGALSMSNASGNRLAVDSQAGVFLDAATGSIRLRENEDAGGTLRISGTGIAMVTRSALEDIAQLTDTALITDRLALNDGVTDGRTLVEADAIQLRSDREVYIQNTSLGTRLDDRRGLVAKSLSIGSRDGGQLDIAINGIVNGEVGVDAIEQIAFDESFTELSSVNGCVILSANTCNKLPFEIIELRDLVEEVLKTDPAENALQVVDSFTKTTLIQLNQIAPAGFEPLIDEPVTGTGNDDLLGEARETGE